jgi:hypothetical protein
MDPNHTPKRTPPRVSAADILRSGQPVYRGSLIRGLSIQPAKIAYV